MGRRYRSIYEDEEIEDYSPLSYNDDDADDDIVEIGDASFKTFADLKEGDKMYIVSLDYGNHGMPFPRIKGVTITGISNDSIYCNRKHDSVFIEEELDFEWDECHTYVDEDTNVNEEFYATERGAADYLAAKLLKIDIQQRVDKYKEMIDDLIG